MTNETQSATTPAAKRFRSPNRSPQERLAEIAQKQAYLASKVAAQECADHPEVQAIEAAISEANKEVINLTRDEKHGAEQAANFRKRAADWDARAAAATTALPIAKAKLSDLRNQRRALLESLATSAVQGEGQA